MLTRRGSSLAELLVALTLGAVVMATATGSFLRQQRTSAALVASARGASQLRSAAALLPAQLALLAPAAQDVVTNEARDTALQLRVAVATGVTCESALEPSLAGSADALTGGGIASPPRGGDSLWWYSPDSARWTGRVVLDAWSDSARCAAADAGDTPGARRAVLHLRLADATPLPARSPLRITRQTRLAVYRSGDGTWQLGIREWSDATHGFAAPQPVAGPFQRVAPDGARTGFRYFDSAGGELPWQDVAAGAAGRIARIRFTALALPAPAVGLARPPGRDSADVALQRAGTP